jgi:hypothetical protein
MSTNVKVIFTNKAKVDNSNFRRIIRETYEKENKTDGEMHVQREIRSYTWLLLIKSRPYMGLFFFAYFTSPIMKRRN